MLFINVILFIFVVKITLTKHCIDNVNNCKKCNPLTNLCEICSYTDLLIPDDNGGCTYSSKCKPGVNYCNECDSYDKLCVNCDGNYHPDKIGGCTLSENCKISYKGKCIECEDDFVLIGTIPEFKICKSNSSDDFNNCEEINIENGKCKICKEGYFLTSGNQKCIKIENCRESIFGNCILCNPNYYYDKKDDKCKIKDGDFSFCQQTLDGKKCDICDEGRYFDEKGICSLGKYCYDSFYGYCQECIEGYYLAKNKFCSFSDNCDIADNDIGICTQCENGFYLDMNDYKCKSNLENNEYKYCSKVLSDFCIQCEEGFYLSKNERCSPTMNCKESENGICIECLDNYYLGLDGICTNVEHCIYSSNYECIQCEDEYFYNKIGNNCTKSTEKFKNCKYSNDGNICSKCNDNYYLRTNDSLCFDNTQEGPLYKCQFSDSKGETCLICSDGYVIGKEDRKCSLIDYCAISENENRCIKCEDYYCLDVKKGICVDNEFLETEDDKIYFACNITNEDGTECEECIDGYQVGSEGYCIDVDRCEIENEGICIKCKDELGERGNNYCANDIFGCVAIFDENCVKCNDLLELYSCTECKEGYKVNINGLCVKEIDDE